MSSSLSAPPSQQCTVVRVEVKGPQNNVRVRQLQVLASPAKKMDCSLAPMAAQQKACEEEALRVFRLLTSQVYKEDRFWGPLSHSYYERGPFLYLFLC